MRKRLGDARERATVSTDEGALPRDRLRIAQQEMRRFYRP